MILNKEIETTIKTIALSTITGFGFLGMLYHSKIVSIVGFAFMFMFFLYKLAEHISKEV